MLITRSFRIFQEHRRFFNLTHKCMTFDINWDYYHNPSNLNDIILNIKMRKVFCDIDFALKKLIKFQNITDDLHSELACGREELAPYLMLLPNSTHPKVLQNESGEPVLLEKVGNKPAFKYFPTNFESLTKKLNTLRTKNLGHMSGNKSYFLKNDMAALEQALVRFSVAKLLKRGFDLVSVPDIISKSVFEGCGMKTKGKHSQVYHIDESWGQDLCLSGTAEMALALYLSSKKFRLQDLPQRICSVSRCYRAEANKHQTEKGIFRVHHFTKVEMFGVTANNSGEESEELLNEFINIQKELFTELGLHFKVLEMPPGDLGLPAYHKIDMEAWIPTQKIYGEISSCSNCTDYQSRRLNIKYESSTLNESSTLKHCHTVNGTACAVPRLLIAIFENFQDLDGSINIPKPLQKYMNKEVISGKFSEKMVCLKPTP